MNPVLCSFRTVAPICVVLFLTFFPRTVAIGAAAAENRPEIQIPFAQTAPVIDGNLDDEVWRNARQPLGDWISYNPLRGEQIKQQTEVFIAYDKKNIYFAFRCLDPEPDKIKASVSRRDNLFQDDWVGLSLDAMGNGQMSYDMFVNANGVQADILDSTSNGEDLGVDWVWTSAGKRDTHGYNAEIRLPLQSIRFKSGARVCMGVLFWRRVSRLGTSVSWPTVPAGQWVFNCHAAMILEDLKSPLVLEALPSVTYSLNQERATPESWHKASSKPDAGISFKYGLTSSVTLDATINPDFSQVESDAFQMEVNRRYPVFYSEKRPFFMEGSSLFNIAAGPNMMTAVHTRRILDPIVGAKLTGTVGRLSFGTLTASDQAPGRPYDDGSLNPFLDKDKLFNVVRATYSLSKGSYIGAILEDTELGDTFNRAVGSDFNLIIGKSHHVAGNFLYTASAPVPGQRKSGMEGYLAYAYTTRRFTFNPRLEHYDKNFQMDTAFYNRTGITMASLYADVNFYPNKDKYSWLKRIVPNYYQAYGRDRIAGGVERVHQFGLDLSLTRQGFAGISYWVGNEPWAHRSFKSEGWSYYGTMQLFKRLRLNYSSNRGYATYYDETNPFQGKSRNYSAGFVLQPSEKITESISFNRQIFNRADTGERVYLVNLINTRSSYQVDRHLSFRLIVQFDSSRHRVLNDFLSAFELVPGTVFYAGYGSLIERRGWDSMRREWLYDSGSYLTTRRGLFFKVSYLQRF